MTRNKLQLNVSKMESMPVKSPRLSVNFPVLLQFFKILVSHLTVSYTWLGMYGTFADRHAFSSVNWFQRYVTYSLLKQLKLSFVLWQFVSVGQLQLPTCWSTDCKKFRTQLHDLSARQKKADYVHPIIQSFKRVRTRVVVVVVVVVVRELLFLVTSVICVRIRGRGSEVTTTPYHIRSDFRLKRRS